MKRKSLTTHKQFHTELLKRPGYKEAYEALEPEFSVIDSIIEARIKQRMTQKELAEKVGITQSAIARIESGKISSTLDTIQKILARVGLKLKVVKA
jgi:DNA-binding XRE family transcriptional regulator